MQVSRVAFAVGVFQKNEEEDLPIKSLKIINLTLVPVVSKLSINNKVISVE